MINRKTSIVAVTILVLLLVGIPAVWLKYKKPAQQATIVAGLTEGQQKTFQQDLSGAMSQYGHIKTGDRLLAKGNFDDALKEYETALSLARSSGSKGEALRSIASLYEKKRDYEEALKYLILVKDKFVADWAKSPILERIRYLAYASTGEYENAIRYAQLAIEADKNLPDSNGKPSPGYIDRLNDLIAAKDYILSLKKK